MKNGTLECIHHRAAIPAFVVVVLALVMVTAVLSGPSVNARRSDLPSSLRSAAIVSGAPPVSNCFGGAPCTGPSATTNGSGTTCVISDFTETAGAFLYVVINYLYGTDLITTVADSGADQFAFVAGEFSNDQSVAFYDVPAEHGGTVTITVTVSEALFGTCRAGQFPQGTMVGSIGAGNSTDFGYDLDLENPAAHAPSLILVMMGSSRPSGGFTMTSPSGSWVTGGQQLTGWNPGTDSYLYAYNDSTAGPVSFDLTCVSPVSISGFAVEFYSGEYPVTIHETGLPSGTTWTAWLDGTYASSNTSSIQFLEPNGTLAFYIGVVPGYACNLTSGEVTVTGAAATVDVTFSPSTARALAFQESGLPPGTTWAVDLNGTLATSATDTVLFAVPGGTYYFQIPAVPGYRPGVTSGVVAVGSSAVTVGIVFSPQSIFPIFFVETGLPTGTTWSVTLNGTLVSSNTPTIMFAEPNGAYSYTVSSSSGYATNVTSGQLTVSGAATTMNFAFTVMPSTSPMQASGSWTDTEWFALGAVAGAVVVAVVALVARSRRKRNPPPSWAEGSPPRNPTT